MIVFEDAVSETDAKLVGRAKERDQGVGSPLEGSGVHVYRAKVSQEKSVFGNLYPNSL